MMLCLIHGYGLSGSGSNRWTQKVIARLCMMGESVHVVTQDGSPDRYDFVSAAYEHDPDGKPSLLFKRETPYEGKCVVHRAELAVLPTYIRPGRASDQVKSILDLDEETLEDYVSRLEAMLRHLVAHDGIDVMHVNHAVLASEAVRRVGEADGIPFVVMPHGSAIEYVVKHRQSMRDTAASVLRACRRILILSPEMRERILDLFPDVPDAERKMVDTNVGVDTDLFEVVQHHERPAMVGRVKRAIDGVTRGYGADDMRKLRDALHDDMTEEALKELLRSVAGNHGEGPDADLEEKLDAVNWRDDDVVAFVGALLAHKGVQALLAAFPSILAARRNARLIVVGSGPLRLYLEAFVEALRQGHRRLARNIARWGQSGGDEREPFTSVTAYLEQLDEAGELEAYFDLAAKRLSEPQRVLFTGYLDHDALSALLPCCDVGVFPSHVKEAGPMVFLEAMASGCLPLGTYFAGMKAKIDTAAETLPPDVVESMKLRRDDEHVVRDIVTHTSEALALEHQQAETLRRTAVDHYDWRIITRQLLGIYRGIASADA